MNGIPPAFIIYSIWLCAVSGCIGCGIGMSLMLWRRRRIELQSHIEVAPPPDVPPTVPVTPSPTREEILLLLASLMKINSDVDARVGRHSIRIEEINQSLEGESPHNGELLVQATKLLIVANQQLQAELAIAETELADQREMIDCFKYESRTDALTQLSNRRAFDGDVNRYLKDFLHGSSGFSLLLIDIDHFKRINDEHGHLNGDQVLATVAQCLQTSLKVPATVSRYGGEEFAVILPGVSGKNAFMIAEQLRQSVENCPHEICGSVLRVTVSIGVAEAVEGDARSDIIERSDEALFAAKNAGRNRCIHCAPKDRPQKCRPASMVARAIHSFPSQVEVELA